MECFLATCNMKYTELFLFCFWPLFQCFRFYDIVVITHWNIQYMVYGKPWVPMYPIFAPKGRGSHRISFYQ